MGKIAYKQTTLSFLLKKVDIKRDLYRQIDEKKSLGLCVYRWDHQGYGYRYVSQPSNAWSSASAWDLVVRQIQVLKCLKNNKNKILKTSKLLQVLAATK